MKNKELIKKLANIIEEKNEEISDLHIMSYYNKQKYLKKIKYFQKELDYLAKKLETSDLYPFALGFASGAVLISILIVVWVIFGGF